MRASSPAFIKVAFHSSLDEKTDEKKFVSLSQEKLAHLALATMMLDASLKAYGFVNLKRLYEDLPWRLPLHSSSFSPQANKA